MCAVCRKPRGKTEYIGWTTMFPYAHCSNLGVKREFCGRECLEIFDAYARVHGMTGALLDFSGEQSEKASQSSESLPRSKS